MDPVIAFCITTFKRNHQIRQTLPCNLSHFRSPAPPPRVFFVVVDFNSDDELETWVRAELPGDLASGLLRYFRTIPPITYWHAALCKNTAHVAAGPDADILMNLDNDQFVVPSKAQQIASFYVGGSMTSAVHDWSGVMEDGTYGRVVMPRRVFMQCGGYNEALVGCGAEDRDIMDRCRALGHAVTRWVLDPTEVGLPNTKQEGIRYVDMPSYLRTFDEMDSHNQRISHENVKSGKWVANMGVVPGLAQDRIVRIK